MKKDIFWNSVKDVFGLTFIAFLPLIISILYKTIKLQSFICAFSNSLHPSEILAFCLSFLAPSIILIKKTHSKNYRLPYLDLFFYSTLAMYLLALIFVFLIKNEVDAEFINNINNYTIYSLGFLFITIIYRIYSTYHQSNSSSFIDDKKNDEKDFIKNFKDMINAK